MATFPFAMLSGHDLAVMAEYLNGLRPPDLIIAPDGNPYLYRWHIRKGAEGCVYLHVQVADDPERPLHDHPWDNMSVILSGGYTELMRTEPPVRTTCIPAYTRKKGDVIFRKAETAHRLLMPTGALSECYTMTQFTTGPKLRNWGFWYPHGWVPYQEVSELLPDGRSIHKPNHGGNIDQDL